MTSANCLSIRPNTASPTTSATTLHANGTSLNFSADLSINDVRDLGITPGSTIDVRLPPNRLRVFAQPPAAT